MVLLQVMGWLADSLGKSFQSGPLNLMGPLLFCDHNLQTQPWPLHDIAVVVEPLGDCKFTLFSKFSSLHQRLLCCYSGLSHSCTATAQDLNISENLYRSPFNISKFHLRLKPLKKKKGAKKKITCHYSQPFLFFCPNCPVRTACFPLALIFHCKDISTHLRSLMLHHP